MISLSPGRSRIAAAATLALAASALAGPARSAAVPANCDRCIGLFRNDGSLLRGRGVKSSSHVQSGVYDIVFKYPIDKCVYTGMIASDNTAFAPNLIISAQRIANRYTLRIDTYSINQAATVDSSFDIAITC